MKGFTFENQGTNTYLVYTVSSQDSVDSMSLGMLTNNKIPGLAPAIFTQMDTTKYIKYNISAHISVKQFFAGPVNKKRLIGVFNGIVDAMLSAEDYMIDVNSILMDLDYIFADVSTCETVLICLPVADTEMPPVDLGAFFKNIMFTTQFDQTENCDHVAKIMNYLNSTPIFSLVDFKNLLNELSAGTNNKPVASVPQPTPVKPVEVKQPDIQVPKTEPVNPVPPVQPVPQNKPVPPVMQKPVVPQGVPVPPVKPAQVPQGQPEAGEKKMSMFYLLQHYNKENAAIYKAQKKGAKNPAPAQYAQPVAPQPKAPAKAKPMAGKANPGFAVPGQAAPSNVGFAIPGQPAQPMVPPVKAHMASAAPVQGGNPVQPVAPVIPKPKYQPPVVPQGHQENFGETIVLDNGICDKTVVMGMTQEVAELKPILIRIKNNEKINLDKPVFKIGKEKSYADYCIGDNSVISRSHANIITRDGEYFVVDTNSTNHTYVNGTQIPSNVETKLSHGDMVRFANEEFEFKLC